MRLFLIAVAAVAGLGIAAVVVIRLAEDTKPPPSVESRAREAESPATRADTAPTRFADQPQSPSRPPATSQGQAPAGPAETTTPEELQPDDDAAHEVRGPEAGAENRAKRSTDRRRRGANPENESE